MCAIDIGLSTPAAATYVAAKNRRICNNEIIVCLRVVRLWHACRLLLCLFGLFWVGWSFVVMLETGTIFQLNNTGVFVFYSMYMYRFIMA